MNSPSKSSPHKIIIVPATADEYGVKLVLWVKSGQEQTVDGILSKLASVFVRYHFKDKVVETVLPCPPCPSCQSAENVVRKGRKPSNGKQAYYCKACPRNFVRNPESQTRIKELGAKFVDLIWLRDVGLKQAAYELGISEVSARLWYKKFAKIHGEKQCRCGKPFVHAGPCSEPTRPRCEQHSDRVAVSAAELGTQTVLVCKRCADDYRSNGVVCRKISTVRTLATG